MKLPQIFSSWPERETLRFSSLRPARNSASDFSRRAKPMIFTPVGSSPSTARLYNAGMSLRCVRSPVAPKMTMLQGSACERETRSSRKGLAIDSRRVSSGRPIQEKRNQAAMGKFGSSQPCMKSVFCQISEVSTCHGPSGRPVPKTVALATVGATIADSMIAGRAGSPAGRDMKSPGNPIVPASSTAATINSDNARTDSNTNPQRWAEIISSIRRIARVVCPAVYRPESLAHHRLPGDAVGSRTE